MEAYGQVYWGAYFKGLTAWRGILMDDQHREVWVGLPEESPDEAYEKMEAEAAEHGITDLRRWSGDPAPIIAD